MDSYKYLFLSIFAGLLLIVSIVSALAESPLQAEAIPETATSEPLNDSTIPLSNRTFSSSETLPGDQTLSLTETPQDNETFSSIETPPDSETISNVSGLIAQEMELNLNFLTSMLQMLALNLHLINELLNAHLEEFPFLQSTIEGTDEGVRTVDNILVVLDMDQNATGDSNVTLHSLNATMSEINSSLTYPDNMIESANMTMGNPNATTPVIEDMFVSVKGMFSLLEQF